MLDKTYLYINGSSVSAGGGFEEYKYRKEIRDIYNSKGIELPETQIECSFGYYISKEYNLQLINHSKSGSGIDRMIRTTFDWIIKNKIKSKQTLFILEPQIGIRLDWYVDEWKDYGILNAHLNEKGEYPSTLVKDWFMDDNGDQNSWNEKYENPINGYLNNFYNENVFLRNEIYKLIFFVSYLNDNNLDYIISIPDLVDEDLKIELNRIIPSKNKMNTFLNNMDLWSYCLNNKWLISDEIDFDDNHIGFEGNKKLAKKIIDSIDKNNQINLNYFLPYDSNSTERCFSFKNVNLNRFENFDSTKIHFIPFDGIRIDLENEEGANLLHDDIITHLNYEFSKSNIHIPVIFFHEHEPLDSKNYQTFISLVTSLLGIEPNKVILVDTNIIDRDGVLNIPLEIKIKQFELEVNENKLEKTHKLSFLNNKSGKLRIESLDKVLKIYKNDVSLLLDENIITYRNYDETTESPSSDVSDIEYYMSQSNYHRYHNTYDFYKNIGFPWTIDDFKIGGEYKKMFKNQEILYGKSYFSIVLETTWDYYNIDHTSDDTQFMAISEKGLVPFCSGNLPFIIHDKTYYNKLESIGFDFSYLKTLFDINYKTNSLKKNFIELDKFVSYMKDNDLNTIQKDYESVKHILDKNIQVIKSIENKKLNNNLLKFIKKLKFE
jgi:hypothetical protein